MDIKDEKEIPQAVIGRLPRYYRYLGDLFDEGVERISSKELSIIMGVTASQIRQDLNHFGGFGQQGYGYNVEYLRDEIGKLLGLDRKHDLVIVGAGNLGRAIANYMNFEKRGFIISGIFDIDERIIGTKIRDIEVKPLSELADYVKDHDVDIGVLTIPRGAAVKTAELLVSCGIKAIWNFAHIDLAVPKDVLVENVHLSDSLMKLSYNCNRRDINGKE